MSKDARAVCWAAVSLFGILLIAGSDYAYSPERACGAGFVIVIVGVINALRASDS